MSQEPVIRSRRRDHEDPSKLRRAWKIAFAGLPALVMALVPAVAATPGSPAWDTPAFGAPPGELWAASVRASAGVKADVLVLLDEASYVFEADGREACTERLIYRVLHQKALEGWSSVWAEWAPWHQQRPALRARVLSEDGSVHELDPATIAEVSLAEAEGDVYGDRRALRAPLPAMAVGVVVEQEITVRDTTPAFGGGAAHLWVVGRPYPVVLSRLRLDAPVGLALRYRARLLADAQPQRDEAAGRVRLTFVHRDLAPFGEIEGDMPDDTPRVPYVAFSSGRSWQDVAMRYAAIVEAQIKGADVKPLLAGSKGKPVRETAGTVLARLRHEVRYTGVEFGNAEIVPRTPAETLRRRFGDCKDQAALLAAALRQAGIEASVALLATGPGLDIDESLPGLGRFNHAIVVVPGKEAIWIDPVASYSRAGELPLEDQGRLALVCSPQTTALSRTPVAPSGENLIVQTREFRLAESGPARVAETIEYRGAIEQERRAYYAALQPDNLREAFVKYANAAFLTDKLGALAAGTPDDLQNPFRITLEAEQAKRGLTGDTTAVVVIPPSSVTSYLPSEFTDPEAEARKGDFQFNPAFVRELRYRVIPPPGFVARPLPENATRRLGPATLDQEFSATKDGVINATLRFDTGKRRLSAAEFEALHTAVRELADSPPITISFDQVGAAHLAAGRVREALEEYDRLIALHPKEALHHVQRARALLTTGMGEEARAEARRAIAVEPTSAAAYRELGWVLQHDLVGRRFKKGFDREGAVAAYRKARELDPSDASGRADLAILLEHDSEGKRYVDKAQLGQAIAEYRAIREQLKVKDYDDNLLVALFWAGRWKELRSVLDDTKLTDRVKALRLACTAALDGGPAAIAEAERRFPEASERRSAMLNGSHFLLNQRLYEEAAQLLDEAVRGADDAGEMRTRVEIIRRSRRYDEVDLGGDEPTAVVRRFLVAAIGERDEKSALALLTPEAARLVSGAESLTRSLVRGFLSSKAARDSGAPVEVLLDIALATLKPTADGDDVGGYRVRFDASLGPSPSLTFYVVRRHEGYRILAMGREMPPLGDEALRRADRGDLEGARRLLDWARDEIPMAGGDDPFAGPVFPRLWARSAAACEGEIRAAAAALMAADASLAGGAVPILEKRRAEAADAATQTACDLALTQAYLTLDRWKDLLTVGERLAARQPTSVVAFADRALALHRLRREDELERVAGDLLKLVPDCSEASRYLAQSRARRGDLVGAHARLLAIVLKGKATREDYNELGWFALFGPPPLTEATITEAIGYAQRGADLTGQPSYPVLHTLACLYAEAGQTNEAHQTILKAMDDGNVEEPLPSDWFLFGRLAEAYGLPGAAKSCYARLPAPMPGEEDATSTYVLAQRRLRALAVPRSRSGR